MIKGSTNSASMGLLFLSGLLAIAFVMTLLMRFHNGETTNHKHPTIAEKHL
jgi:ACS family tartrate transporter-like MFS transporter